MGGQGEFEKVGWPGDGIREGGERGKKWNELKVAEREDSEEGERQIMRRNKEKTLHGKEVTISLLVPLTNGTTHKS